MKLKLLSIFLVIFVLCGVFFLVKYTAGIENPTETSENAAADESITAAPDENAVSRTFVIKCAHDTENLFSRLAYEDNKEYSDAFADMKERLEKSAEYLKNDLQDFYGSAYFSKLAGMFADIAANPFANAADFSARVSSYLKDIDSSFPKEEAEKADEFSETEPMYYPRLDTNPNGALALGLLSVFNNQKKADGKVIITVGGNVVMGDSILTADSETSYKKNLENSKYQYPFFNISSVLHNDDISLANLASPFTTSTDAVSVEGGIKGLPEYAKIFKKSGIEAVSVSDPGVKSYGDAGKADTKNALKEAECSYSDEGEICYLDSRIGKIAFITYDIIEESQTMKKGFIDAPKADIAAARQFGAAVVIVNFNWVNTFSPPWDPSLIQIYTVRAAADNGANLVYSTHPCNMEAIEKYKGVYLIYSAGNLSDKTNEAANSFLFSQEFYIDGAGAIQNGKASIYPLRATSAAGGNIADGYGMPYIMLSSAEVEAFKAELIRISSTVRYGLNKKQDSMLADIDIISVG